MSTMRLSVVAPTAEIKTRESLVDILQLACNWLGPDWSVVDEPEAASLLVMVTNGSTYAKELWAEYRKIFPAERILVYGSEDLPAGTQWSTPKIHGGLPSVLSLVNILLAMEESLAGFSASDEYYDPKDYIHGILKEALVDGIGRVCSVPEAPDIQLYILPKERACYILDDIEKSIPICTAKKERIQVTKISDEELLKKVGYVTLSSRLSSYTSGLAGDLLEKISFRKAKQYSVKEFIWFAALVNSKGRMLAGCTYDEHTLVRHWPEFTRLPYYHDYLETSKRMSVQALRLTDVAAQTKRSMRQIIDFHNACTLLGLIVRGDQAQRQAQQYLFARKQLHNLFKPFASQRGNRIKIVVAGTVGSGKTTAISTLSDFSPVTTETRPSDAVSQKKMSTTVGMEYGETRFEDMKLFLYGTPGQRRFDFMGEILCHTAWGLLILIDNTEENPIAELDYYLNLYRSAIPKMQVMIGVTHFEENGSGPSLEAYRAHLAAKGHDYPVAKADPREYIDMVRFLRDVLAERSETLPALKSA